MARSVRHGHQEAKKQEQAPHPGSRLQGSCSRHRHSSAFAGTRLGVIQHLLNRFVLFDRVTQSDRALKDGHALRVLMETVSISPIPGENTVINELSQTAHDHIRKVVPSGTGLKSCYPKSGQMVHAIGQSAARC